MLSGSSEYLSRGAQTEGCVLLDGAPLAAGGSRKVGRGSLFGGEDGCGCRHGGAMVRLTEAVAGCHAQDRQACCRPRP